jgi:hypothetical protein
LEVTVPGASVDDIGFLDGGIDGFSTQLFGAVAAGAVARPRR